MKRLMVTAVIFALVAAVAGAQQPIRVGDGFYLGYMHEGLNSFDGYRGQEYLVQVESGLAYQIDVMSDDFDAYVVVYLPDGSRLFDDDGGEGLNARIVVEPETSGEMRVIARSFSRTPVGNYAVEIMAFSTQPAEVRQIGPGMHFGNLGPGSGSFEDYRADEYLLPVIDGQGLQIDVMSNDFDAYVVILHPDGTREFDDDGGSGLDARLRTTARGNGFMRIFARGWRRDPAGSYTLEVQEFEMVSVAPVPIQLGAHEGFVDFDSAEYEGYRGVEYELPVRAGETYQIDVMSDDFDAYVVVFHPDGTREFDDDGGEGFNARLLTTPRTSGTMRIIARGWRSEPVGAFTLVTEVMSRQ